MKKIILTSFAVVLFACSGMAQNAEMEEMETSKTINTIKATSKPVEISTEERAYMETLKRTDTAAYRVYLKERKDIALMENQLENQKEMDSAKKVELTIKLNELKAKHSF